MAEAAAAVRTVPKQLAQFAFQPGNSANPNGRPKGSRNKLGEAFVEALHDDFQTHGIAAIEKVRVEKPDQYLKVIAQVIPKEFIHSVDDYDSLSDDALAAEFLTLAGTLQARIDDRRGTGAPGDIEGSAVELPE